MIDSLLWTAVTLLLGLKLATTFILLRHPAETRLATRQGRRLWWATKITPPLAVPFLIAAARLEHDRTDMLVYPLLMVFVLVAAPVMVWRRFVRQSPVAR